MAQYLDLLRAASMHRYQDGIDRTLAHDSHRIRYGIPVYHGKAAAAGGVYPRSLHREKDRRHGGRPLG
jgi:hypothetical protein